MSDDAMSITGKEFPLGDIVEPLTLIRSDIRKKRIELEEGLRKFVDFINKRDEDEVTIEKTGKETFKKYPYPFRREHQSKYREFTQVISAGIAYSLTTAKAIRQELYVPTDQSKNYDVPEEMVSTIPSNFQKSAEKKRLPLLGKLYSQSYDPNSPLHKMEKSIQKIEVAQDYWIEWLGWWETLVLATKSQTQTMYDLHMELDTLMAVFGHTVEHNIWIAFEYVASIRVKDAERYAVQVAIARKEQENRERTDLSKQLGNF